MPFSANGEGAPVEDAILLKPTPGPRANKPRGERPANPAVFCLNSQRASKPRRPQTTSRQIGQRPVDKGGEIQRDNHRSKESAPYLKKTNYMREVCKTGNHEAEARGTTLGITKP